jgi:hypothetical protein
VSATAGSPSELRVPWSWLSIGLGVVAAASLGTLVVVAAVQDADALSTVALALAVIAFGAQLIVSLVQVQAQATQLAEVERVNTETHALLAQINAQGASLLTNQRDQFDRVLEYALRDALPNAVADSTMSLERGEEGPLHLRPVAEVEGFSSRFRQSFESALRDGLSEGSSGPNPYQGFIDRITSYPPSAEAAAEAIATFNELTPREASALTRRAVDDLRRARLRQAPEGWTPISKPEMGVVTRNLETLGLIEFVPGDHPDFTGDGYWRRLTPLGIEVARLLVAAGAPPDWLAAGIPTR